MSPTIGSYSGRAEAGICKNLICTFLVENLTGETLHRLKKPKRREKTQLNDELRLPIHRTSILDRWSQKAVKSHS